MARHFHGAAIIFITACHLGHGLLQSGHSSCTQITLQTPAGTKLVGCDVVCQVEPKLKVDPSNRICLVASTDVVQYMTSGVNYTCELGVCDKNTCVRFDVLIGCWKP
uniref:Evasin n=1 Tax=Rhipicephalus microplus TaxID=6941 RepID=A0A6M2D6G5_RHIMP